MYFRLYKINIIIVRMLMIKFVVIHIIKHDETIEKLISKT